MARDNSGFDPWTDTVAEQSPDAGQPSDDGRSGDFGPAPETIGAPRQARVSRSGRTAGTQHALRVVGFVLLAVVLLGVAVALLASLL